MSEAAYVQVIPHTAGVICAVTCEKVGGREAQIIENEIKAATTSAAKRWRIVVDMAQVTMLASMGLGALVTLHKQCSAEGGRMVVCNLRPDILAVMKITHLDRILKIVATREDALKLLG